MAWVTELWNWTRSIRCGGLTVLVASYFPLCRVEESKLQYVACTDESVMFVDDATGELVGFVIHNWCSQPAIAASVAEIVYDLSQYKKSCQVHSMFSTRHLPAHCTLAR